MCGKHRNLSKSVNVVQKKMSLPCVAQREAIQLMMHDSGTWLQRNLQHHIFRDNPRRLAPIWLHTTAGVIWPAMCD
jgi:hypothetical protein